TRELENALRSWTATVSAKTIELEHLTIEDSEEYETDIDVDLKGPYKLLKERVIERFTRDYVCRLLKQTQGNVSASAEISGITRQSLQKIIHRYEINTMDYR
ncbi:MAG: sigma-54-dependent Fis family transcriptional regulator, partial [Deltaproteobacteria bacterium]|nr:sigma-54-dependent Fis family transcriptional regulator [Deltaproteobacteria bacterium]